MKIVALILFVLINGLNTAIASENSIFDIIPKPKEAYYKSNQIQEFNFDKTFQIFIKSDTLINSTLYMNELLLEQKIPNLKVKIVSKYDLTEKGIFLGISDEELNNFVNSQNNQKYTVNAINPGKEGYLIDISKDRYIINSSDVDGLVYGIATFQQLISIKGNGSNIEYFIKNARIIDKPDLAIRWLYYPTNVLVDGNSKPTKELWKNSAKLKMNGVNLTDVKFEFISEMQKKYSDSLKSLKNYADFYHLKLALGCMPFGYSNSILYFNPNFAEGLPVINQEFIVDADTAKLLPTKDVRLTNGGFENYNGNNPTGFSFIDKPGQTSFIDTEVKHSGNASLRFEKIYEADPTNATGRITARIIADKYKMYHISGWIKTENFTPVNSLGINVLSTTTKRSYQFANINVPSTTNGWQKIDVNFNSLDADTLFVYWAIRGCKTGKIWWDDINVEEYAFTNLIRRETAPFQVYNKSARIPLIETSDYDSLVDKKTGYVNKWAGEYDIFHQAPTFRIRPTSSKVRNGDTLQISYHNAITIYDGQVMASMTEPKLKEQIEKQFLFVNGILQSEYFFMNTDEIRVLNWETLEKFKAETPAELIANNANWGYEMIKRSNPNAKVCDWSDMYDEFHNAVKGPYYLVNGDLRGSADILNKDIIIANWNTGSNFQNAPKSLKFFEDKGFKQIVAPYYDTDQNHIRKWKEAGRDFSGFLGMMYTTWSRNYSFVSHFAEYSWNHSPYLSHTPLSVDTILDKIKFKIDVVNDKWDSGSLVNKVKLFYRFNNSNQFDSLVYTGSIIDSVINFELNKASEYIEYYIFAEDSRGWTKRLPIDEKSNYVSGKLFSSVKENDQVRVFYNSDEKYIELNYTELEITESNIGLFDELGVELSSNKFQIEQNNDGMIRIRIPNLIPGVYFVKKGNKYAKFLIY